MEFYEASRMTTPEIIDHLRADYSTSRDMPTVIPQLIGSHIPMCTPHDAEPDDDEVFYTANFPDQLNDGLASLLRHTRSLRRSAPRAPPPPSSQTERINGRTFISPSQKHDFTFRVFRFPTLSPRTISRRRHSFSGVVLHSPNGQTSPFSGRSPRLVFRWRGLCRQLFIEQAVDNPNKSNGFLLPYDKLSFVRRMRSKTTNFILILTYIPSRIL